MTRHLLLAALLLGGNTHSADPPGTFESGMQALEKGNYAEAYCLWKPLADRGYAEAQYHLGWLYANGNGLAVDIQHALSLWIKAANQGHADARFAVGLAYTTGDGLKKDLNEAVKWYLAAARQGHQDAREILVRLNDDTSLDLLQSHPEIVNESWFGALATVRNDRVNLRAGPSTTHKIVGKLDKGDNVRVIGQRGDWQMIVLPGAATNQVAWIHRKLTKRVSK